MTLDASGQDGGGATGVGLVLRARLGHARRRDQRGGDDRHQARDETDPTHAYTVRTSELHPQACTLRRNARALRDWRSAAASIPACERAILHIPHQSAGETAPGRAINSLFGHLSRPKHERTTPRFAHPSHRASRSSGSSRAGAKPGRPTRGRTRLRARARTAERRARARATPSSRRARHARSPRSSARRIPWSSCTAWAASASSTSARSASRTSTASSRISTKSGESVFVTVVPPFDTSAARAQALSKQIDDILKRTGKAKVNLVGHSQGGMDARVITSPQGLGYGDRVASVTTVATPHRGSKVADAVLGLLQYLPADVIDSVTGDFLKLVEKTAYELQTRRSPPPAGRRAEREVHDHRLQPEVPGRARRSLHELRRSHEPAHRHRRVRRRQVRQRCLSTSTPRS